MTENPISISNLNDFVFCPMSIYFHMLYGEMDNIERQSLYQINGTAAHESIDTQTYSTSRNVLQGISVYCEKYGLIGKIDLYYVDQGLLVERKRQIKTIYDGYVFQLYAQYFGLREQGYEIKIMQLYSSIDNKKYNIPLPEDNLEMLLKFQNLIKNIRDFSPWTFQQNNAEKCRNCIYEPACDRCLD